MHDPERSATNPLTRTTETTAPHPPTHKKKHSSAPIYLELPERLEPVFLRHELHPWRAGRVRGLGLAPGLFPFPLLLPRHEVVGHLPPHIHTWTTGKMRRRNGVMAMLEVECTYVAGVLIARGVEMPRYSSTKG